MSEIPTWHERAMRHPDHQSGMVSEGMLRARMAEEISDLRAEVERLREDNEKLRELLRSIRIDGPDFEGLVWVSFVSQGLAARAHVVVGEENRMASRVALRFKELRRAALEAKP